VPCSATIAALVRLCEPRPQQGFYVVVVWGGGGGPGAGGGFGGGAGSSAAACACEGVTGGTIWTGIFRCGLLGVVMGVLGLAAAGGDAGPGDDSGAKDFPRPCGT
jgi:hypothetical protein